MTLPSAGHASLLSRSHDAGNILAAADQLRFDTNKNLNPRRRGELGQFMTPAPVAALMASMIGDATDQVRLLDAGAGVGSLSAGAIAELLSRPVRPTAIRVTAFEIDPVMIRPLRQTLDHCAEVCFGAGVRFSSVVLQEDFLDRASTWLSCGLFTEATGPRFNLAIQNPPYKKMHSASGARSFAREFGIETSNLYTAFLAATIQLLEPGGQLVAISPRSFCNGPYFLPFRELVLKELALRRIHVFNSRHEAFKDDQVLQETVIVSAHRGMGGGAVEISSSDDARSPITSRIAPFSEIVRPGDSHRFIRILSGVDSIDVAEQMAALPYTLGDLGLVVSTGRVVDFRAKEHLRSVPDERTIPLIYPTNIVDGTIVWPRQTRKPQALHSNEETESLMVPAGPYVVTKRFSAKEERRRVVAAVLDPAQVPGKSVGLENHLNYYHRSGMPLDMELAKGLSRYLNTTLVDDYFRQFNGHTQVNATDLRALRYPSEQTLRIIGALGASLTSDQAEVDTIVQGVIS